MPKGRQDGSTTTTIDTQYHHHARRTWKTRHTHTRHPRSQRRRRHVPPNYPALSTNGEPQISDRVTHSLMRHFTAHSPPSDVGRLFASYHFFNTCDTPSSNQATLCSFWMKRRYGEVKHFWARPQAANRHYDNMSNRLYILWI